MRRGGGPVHAAPAPREIPPATSAAPPDSTFPKCASELLAKVTSAIRASGGPGKQPKLSQFAEWQSQIDSQIFFLTPDQFHVSKLTPHQRSALLQMFAIMFKEKAEDANRYSYFEVIFLGREDEPVLHEQRIGILFDVASYSLQYPVFSIFTTISQWLSKDTTPRIYSERLISLLVDHFIKPDPALKMYEHLLPLDFKCPEFVTLFITLAHRTVQIGIPLVIVYGTFMQAQLMYILSQYRDAEWMAQEFATEVFPKCLSYIMAADFKELSPEEEEWQMTALTSLCAGILPIIKDWNNKVKDIELDYEPIFDNSYPWSTYRADLLIIYGRRSEDNYNRVKKFVEQYYPPQWVISMVDNYLSVDPPESGEIS